jgi:peptidoglycan endopeptidase LytE
VIQGGFLKRPLLSLLIVIVFNFVAQNGFPDTTYVIQKGDNPSTIAKKFHVKSKDILSINDLDPRRLLPGTEIIIPSNEENPLDTDTLSQEHDTTCTRDIERKEDVPDTTIMHRVKRGDTLSHLSRQYSISIHALQEMNNLTSTKLLVGQTLLVKQAQQKTYTVKKGDSLWKIARRFHCNVDELSEMNELTTDMLKPGQIIVLRDREEPEHFNHTEVDDFQKKIEDGIDAVSESDEYTMKEKLLILAKNFLDIPYKFGGSSFLGIDCSAFVQEVFSLIGIDLPRSAREQFSHGDPINKEELSVGDLVFFRTYASFPSHVGIYLGNNEFIHTSSKLKKVTIDSLKTPYYLKRFIGAKRLIREADGEEKGEHQYES